MSNKKLEDKVMNRRRFLQTAGKVGAGIALASLPIISSCKGNNPAGPEPPTPNPVPVNLTFTVYNHTQGKRAEFVKPGVMSESNLAFSVSELTAQYGISDVYGASIVIRKAPFSSTAAYSLGSGACTLKVPREDTEYSIFLFNKDGQAFYQANEAKPYPLEEMGPKSKDAYRIDFDNFSGEERVWGGEFVPEIGDYGVFDQFNKVLHPEWAPFEYGNINRKPMPNDQKGDFGYGFGDCHGKEAASFIPNDWCPIEWCGIDPRLIPDVKTQIQRGLAIVFAKVMRGGLVPYMGQETYQVIQTNGVLNQVGKDIITYLYI
jgi:hypothetical protein